jgi:hypothetical protein
MAQGTMLPRTRLTRNRICLWGTSAVWPSGRSGGTRSARNVRGDCNSDKSSAVRCVLDAYGPTRFDVMDTQTQEEHSTLQSPVVTVNVQGSRGGERGGAPSATSAPW